MELLQTTIASVVGPVVVLIVGWQLNRKLKKASENTSQVLDQVKNSHEVNLRDNLDEIHKDVKSVQNTVNRHDRRLDGIEENLANSYDLIIGLSRDDTAIRKKITSMEDRIRELERFGNAEAST